MARARMEQLVRVCCVVLALATLSVCQSVPQEGCPTENTDVLSQCLADTLEQLRPFFKTGIPERGVPPGDPLLLKVVTFESDESVEARYTDVVVRGFSAYQIHSLRVDPAARTISFDLTVPRVLLTGRYNVKGTFLVLQVTSSGNFTSLITGAHVRGTGNLSLKNAQGLRGRSLAATAVQMDNLEVKLKLDKTQHAVDFDPGTNPIIGKTVRHLVTNNDRILLDEIQPEIEGKVAEIMSRLVNQVLTLIPVDALSGR